MSQRLFPALLGAAMCLGLGAVAPCNGDGGAGGSAAPPGDGGIPITDGGTHTDGPVRTVTPTDPCQVAGYYFDDKSDCNVVRGPNLTCKCASTAAVKSGAP